MFDRYAFDDAVWASDLPMPSKAVALYLARCASGDGRAFPCWATMQRATGMSRATLARHLRTLRAAGWLADTGERRGRGVVVYRCAGLHVRPNPSHSETQPVSQRDPEASKEASKEDTHSPSHGMDPAPGEHDPERETMDDSKQPPLFRPQTAPEAIRGSEESQDTHKPTQAPQKAPAPFKSAAESESWNKAATLWQSLASGTLRPHRRIRPDRGGGHHLLRSLRVLGEADVLRTILWMTCAPESHYLRDSDNPRGMDTLWNQRKHYPERAEEWLEADHRACVLAARHGVPLPEGMPVVHETPKPAIDMAARATARALAHAQRLRELGKRSRGEE